MITEFLKAVVTLLVIMDPFAGIPVFLTLTKGRSIERMRASANRAAKVAGLLLIIFIFMGKSILDFFHISLEALMIGGGLIMALVGVGYVLDIRFNKHEADNYEKDITIPMATPLISGPGVFTTAIILVSLYGHFVVALAALIDLAIFWLLMRYSNIVLRVVGHQGLEILSRVMGLILVAVAVQFIINGVTTISF